MARICKLVHRKKFGLICFPRLIYCDQEPLLLLNLTVHLFGCTYKAISTRYKICFTPKSLNFSMGASLLAVSKSIYYNPYSLDNNRCDKRILAITNLETENKTNKPRKNVLYLLNCAYRLGRLKRQQTSDGLRFLHRSYMRTKQNGGLLLREKQVR